MEGPPRPLEMRRAAPARGNDDHEKGRRAVNRREAIRTTCAAVGTGILMQLRPYDMSAAGQDGTGMAPFRIEYGWDRIHELHRRLDAMTWPEMPFDTGWSAGTSDRVLRDLVRYWRHEYNWFIVQAELNRLEHYRVPIEGEQLHFVWYRGEGERQPFPLLLLHGWPSSFLEFTRAAPALMRGVDGQPGFDLVVPSLPGFALSDAPRTPGRHVGRVADHMHLMMRTLGYDRYGVQGGDWGAVVAVEMARRYPNSVAGLHFVAAPSAELPEVPRDEAERAFTARRRQFDANETAYFELQSTKPQTLAYALQDSPVGLLAWILEKYWAWTDHDGDLWERLDRDHVLTTAMLYWLTGRTLSAARIYYETRQMLPEDWSRGPISVRTGYARFPREPWGPPRSLASPDWVANLVHYADMPRGGHFPALEEPVLWAGDVAAFFAEGNGAPFPFGEDHEPQTIRPDQCWCDPRRLGRQPRCGRCRWRPVRPPSACGPDRLRVVRQGRSQLSDAGRARRGRLPLRRR